MLSGEFSADGKRVCYVFNLYDRSHFLIVRNGCASSERYYRTDLPGEMINHLAEYRDNPDAELLIRWLSKFPHDA